MTPALRLLRRVSAALLLIWAGVFVTSFARRQIERRSAVGEVELGDEVKQGTEQPVRVHKGFVYTDTIGVEPNFRVAARETVQFASGWYELRNVEVWLYDHGEVAYGMTAQQARFNQERREAQASGDVQVSLRGGVAVKAESFSLRGPERLLASQGAATFAGAGWAGVAGGVACSLAEDTLDMVGGVSITWRETPETASPLVLLTPTLKYFRKQALFRFPEGLTLLQGSLRIHAASAEVQLRQAEGALQSVTLDEPVELEALLEGGANLAAKAGTSTLEALDGGRFRITCTPAAGLGWVEVHWRDKTGQWRELTTWRLVGEGTRVSWEWLEGQGLACATELVPREEAREIEGERMRLSFSAEKPATAEAEGNVRIAAGTQWARGERLAYSVQGGTFSLKPAAKGRVAMASDEIELEGGSIENGENGELLVKGQVIGLARQGALWGSAQGPVHFAADSVRAAARGTRLTLDGDARLWQEDRLVRADHLAYDRQGDVVAARGKVLTRARPKQGTALGDEIQLRARSLDYQPTAAVATYEGDVLFEDVRSTASCQRLSVTLNENGEVVLANLEGGVVVREKTTNRVLRGERARLDAPHDLLELWGSPVLIEEPGGNQVKGASLQWRRGTETVTVNGEEDRPTETIYHAAIPGPTPKPAPVPKRRKP